MWYALQKDVYLVEEYIYVYCIVSISLEMLCSWN